MAKMNGARWSLVAAVLAVCLNGNAYSAPETAPYRVHVETELGVAGAVAAIAFQTVENHPTTCGRTTTELTVALPAPTAASRLGMPPVGKIAFKTELRAATICLMTFGPHHGGVELLLGDTLPRVPDGYYALEIDGRSYGYVNFEDGNARLVSRLEPIF